MVYEIRTSRLRLRGFEVEDLAAFRAFADSEPYRRYLAPQHPSAEQFVANNTGPESERDRAWVIERDGVVIGSVFLGLSGDEPGELACLLNPDSWRQGFAREAAAAVIAYAFSESGLSRVWATCHADNLASVGVLEGLGLQRQPGARTREDGSPELHFSLTRCAYESVQ